MTALRIAILFFALYSRATILVVGEGTSGRSLIETNISGIVKSTGSPAASLPTAWNLNLSRVVALVITSTQNERFVPGIFAGSAMSGVTVVVNCTRRNGL